LDSGGKSLIGFLRNIPYRTIGEAEVKPIDPKLKSFLNMNTKEDLAELMEMLS